MNSQIDFRKSKRFEHISTVMLEDELGGYYSYGQISNYSDGGMGFWSDVAFKKGAEITVSLNNPPFKSAPKSYHGKVRWCKEMGDDESQYFYRMGLKYS